jgi:hypothetical protein
MVQRVCCWWHAESHGETNKATVIGMCRSDFTIVLPTPIIYLSYRWNNAGPACLLWRLSFDSVTAASADGTGSTRFSPQIVSDWAYDQQSLASYGGFVDLWPVPPPSTTYLNACSLLGHLVGILIRPRVVCFMSNEVAEAVARGRLDGSTESQADGSMMNGSQSVENIGGQEEPSTERDVMQEKQAIAMAGKFRVEKIGAYYCVAVFQPHPGYFAYTPSLQPLLFPLFICCSALVRCGAEYLFREDERVRALITICNIDRSAWRKLTRAMQ